jgi:predicted DNA-binding transcriptional regulator AlpA
MYPAESRQKRMLPAREAADLSGLSKSTLDKMRVFGGGPPYLKIGRRVVYDPVDLDHWLASHRRKSTSEHDSP